jgi:carbon-monoxide dehydrogenase medium subunit
MHNFDYFRPADLGEALTLRNKWKKSSSLLLGGTDLLLAIDAGAVVPDVLIDLKGVEALDCLEKKGGNLEIGARVTYTTLVNSPIVKKHFPGIWESSRLVASVGVRNSATMAGNICNAVPSAESAAPLLTRDALILINSVDGNREVPISDFFTGPRKTVVKENEIVTAICVPYITGKFGESYVKLGRYRGEDIAQVAVSVTVDSLFNYKIAYAAVGPVPIRIPEAETLLSGKTLSSDLLEKAQDAVIAAVSPISDIRASREYRIHMCRIMLEKALSTAVSRMESSIPEYGIRLI